MPALQMNTLRVLDMTDSAAVYGARLLADLGADVVRIDTAAGGGRDAADRFFNAGKRSVVVDVRRPEGMEVLVRLSVAADAVLDGIEPRLDNTPRIYTRCRAANPRLVWVAVRPFAPGVDGRFSRSATVVRYALSGLMSITGLPGQPPQLLGGGLSDAITAVYAALACMLGFRLARRTGEGRLVHVGAHEALVTAMQQGLYEAALAGRVVTRGGGRHAHIGMAGALPCLDGYVVISANERRMWNALVELIGDERLRDPALQDEGSRLARQAEIFEIIGAWTQRFAKVELSELAQARGIPVAPVHTIDDLLIDPQLRARGFLQRVGEDEMPGLTVPWARRLRPAALPGEHTWEVLRGAGYSRGEIGRLEADGVIATGQRVRA